MQHGQLREPPKDPLHNSIHGAGEQFRGPESQRARVPPWCRGAATRNAPLPPEIPAGPGASAAVWPGGGAAGATCDEPKFEFCVSVPASILSHNDDETHNDNDTTWRDSTTCPSSSSLSTPSRNWPWRTMG